MYGPVFKVGDKVVWVNFENARKYISQTEPGPFTVITYKNNRDPRECSCGANRSNQYFHQLATPAGNVYCGELPAQWVTVRKQNGEVLKSQPKNENLVFASAWFKLLS